MAKWAVFRHMPRHKGFVGIEKFGGKQSKQGKYSHLSKKAEKARAKRRRVRDGTDSILRVLKTGSAAEGERIALGSCARKNRYETLGEAKVKAVNYHYRYKNDSWVYKCRLCGKYHLTTEPEQRYDGTYIWGTAPLPWAGSGGEEKGGGNPTPA